MFVRISLILAILAAIAVGVVNGVFVKDKITMLTTDRNTQKSQKEQALSDLNHTQNQLKATNAVLAQTQQDLAAAKQARDAAVATAAAQQKRADDLSTKLTKATQDRDVAQSELDAYTQIGTAKEFADMKQTLNKAQAAIEALNEEKVVMNRRILQLQAKLDVYEGTNKPIELPANLRGQIVVVDPKWDFVVMNVGLDQGIIKQGSELLVSRNGRLVAKVKVTSIQKDRSIANLMPGWKLGEVFEGDEVTPAYPAS